MTTAAFMPSHLRVFLAEVYSDLSLIYVCLLCQKKSTFSTLFS